MKSKKIYFIIIPLLILILLAGAGILGLYHYINNVPSVSKDTTLEIKKGEGLRAISQNLERNAVVVNEHLFVLYVMYEGLQDQLKAGEYKFESGSTMSQVVGKLSKGDVVVYNVTIPEGLTVSEIGELLQDQRVISKEEFLLLTQDKELRTELLRDRHHSFEGYLFPDTYSYNKGVTALEIVKMMVKRFNTVYGSLENERVDTKLTDNEIITLASIIEKETGSPDERELVSAVFHNRLRIGMKLDSDPTVIYGLGEGFNGTLTRSDLKHMTEYNTYLIKGLPPGPIANPGKESITAAMYPADVNYLYFVSKGDGTGTHKFSSNYQDHKRAVNEYRKNIKP
jgi:peptidoglycan lytic transglycosylase G